MGDNRHMRSSRKRPRWWILAPSLLSLLVPVWVYLGDVLGYELFITPEPVTPRYDSAIFYFVWWPLFLVFEILGSVLAFPFNRLVPDSMSWGVSALFAGAAYSAFLYVIVEWIHAARSRRSPRRAS